MWVGWFFHPRPSRINFTQALPGRPSSALRHWDVVESWHSEVADSVRARTCKNKKTGDMDGLRYSPDDLYYKFGLVHTCLYVRVRENGDWDLRVFPGPLERALARAETGGADWGVFWRWGFPGVARVNKVTLVSLEYPLSVFNKNSTLKKEYGLWNISARTDPQFAELNMTYK